MHKKFHILITTLIVAFALVGCNTKEKDTIEPTITVSNELPTRFNLDDELPSDWTKFITITDNIDGEITVTNEMISTDLTTSTAGYYKLTITVSDKAGNTQTKSITIGVYDPANIAYPFEQYTRDYSKNKVWYTMFVRSFADSNGDGIGDFKGIENNLDYLSDLGIGGLWLLPINPSPSYHGYDVTDYYGVNSQYGTMEDFESLLAAADEKGIDIVMDLVINHSSSQHPWFEAATSKSSSDYNKYRDYYTWINSTDPRRTKLGDWDQKIWHYKGGQYYAGYFWDGMPDLNLYNPAVIEEINNIGKFWLEKGVKGFRLDAAHHYFGKNEIPATDSTIIRNINFLTDFQNEMKKYNEDVYVVGEVWKDSNTYAPYYKAIDSVFNFEQSYTTINAVKNGGDYNYSNNINNIINKFEKYVTNAVDSPFLSNHDTERVASQLSGDKDKMRLAAESYLSLSGTPYLYYGEELGMFGYKSNGQDVSDETRRLPFLWEDSSQKTTWHIHSMNDGVASAENQQNDSTSLYNAYKKLIGIRNQSNALSNGEFIPISVGGKLQGYKKQFTHDTLTDETVIVIHNFSNIAVSYDLSEYDTGEVLYVSNNQSFDFTKLDARSTVLIKLP